MSDEEMADKYAEEKVSNLDECRTKDLMRSVCKDGFLAGLKAGRQEEQLTKAKEIIKNCIHILKHSGTALDWKTVINQAEQFIKEIEK